MQVAKLRAVYPIASTQLMLIERMASLVPMWENGIGMTDIVSVGVKQVNLQLLPKKLLCKMKTDKSNELAYGSLK